MPSHPERVRRNYPEGVPAFPVSATERIREIERRSNADHAYEAMSEHLTCVKGSATGHLFSGANGDKCVFCGDGVPNLP
jgi:hypothetical protein